MKRLITGILFLTSACASANRSAVRDIDRFVETTVREVPDMPSVGVAVVQDGRVVYLKNADVPYYIGSTTKAYTGLATAILAQRGLIDLDAPISKYLPTTVNVTLRALLTHSSGIQNGPIVYRTAFTGEHTYDQLVGLLNQSKTIKPGFRYDNLGYVIASLVIERVTGKPWQQELDELVFQPLGMTHTTAYMSKAKQWNMPQPHWVNRAGETVPLTFEKVDATMHAAGGIVTTPRDLSRWLIANLAHSGGGIPRAAFDEAEKLQVQTPADRGEFVANGYAFGWFHGDFHGQHAMFHGGGYEGWHSWYAMLPEKRIGAGALTNINGRTNEAADLIVSYSLARLSEMPNVETDYAKQLDTVKANVAKSRESLLADVANRAKRPWSLTHPNSAYTGRYEHPGFGTLTIEERDGKLYASIGRLTSVMEAFTKPESARVEMTPGTGEVLVFNWSDGDKPDSVVWDRDTFVRVR